ncbi:MAG: RNA polymerase sigma factor [Aggregatilineales bacterium]
MEDQLTGKPYQQFLTQSQQEDKADSLNAQTTVSRDFSAVYEAHKLTMYRYVLARVGHVQDAHDITAQVFLKAYQNAATYREDSPVLHWLIGIARHAIIDHYRRARTELPLELVQQLPHDAPPIEETVENRLRLKRVAEALNSLSEDRREALTLRLFAGLKNQEIAGVMGKSADAVAMLVHRGVQDLNARLGKDDQ